MHKKMRKTDRRLIPVILALGFIPLIMHAFYYDCRLSEFDWFPDNAGTMSDFFLAWKMVAIIIMGCIMLLILSVNLYQAKGKEHLENSFYALLVYALFVIMSALFSGYKYWVFAGSHQMFESLWVVLAYMIFCCYTYLYVKNEAQVYLVLKYAGIGSFILMLIGAFQFFGLDLFHTTVGRLLVTNPSSWGNETAFHVNVSKYTVYTTLYNQNFLSFYFGIAIPVILGLFLAAKKKTEKLLLAVAELLAVLCMIGCRSASGWMALCIAFAVTTVVLLSRTKKGGISGGIVAAVLLVCGITACLCTTLGSKASALFGGTADFPALKSIDTTGDCIEMDIDGNIFKVDYLYNEETGQLEVHIVDRDGNALPTENVSGDATTVRLTDEAYQNGIVAAVMYGDKIGIQITLDGHDWLFTKNDAGQYVLVNQAGKEEVYQSADFSTFFRNDAFSGRGHIWDGCLSILHKYLFVGSGANTFMFAYPQNDYIYRAYMNTQNMLDVKAHNMYLQQWIENGMIAMLAFVVFCFWYVIASIRLYRKTDLTDGLARIGLGIFTGVVCYLTVGIANDSNVCTAPVFWIILGLGMSVNRMIVEKNKK